MTSNELDAKIAESPHREWYQKYSISLNYAHINFHVKLTGVSAIYQFILDQIAGFDNLEQLPQELSTVKSRFISAKETIIRLIRQDENSKHRWDNDLAQITNSDRKLFVHDAPETEFLITLKKEKPEFYEGAYYFLIGNMHQLSEKKHFIGYLLAYEFTTKGESGITARRESEKNSISKIRSDFQNALDNAKTQLVEHLGEASKASSEYAQKIDFLKKQKEELFNGWFEKASKDFNLFNTASNDKIRALEDLYQQKLKLEAPAKYWQERAKSLRNEGRQWLWLLVISVCVAVGILMWILTQISNATLYKLFENTGTAIKWSIILVTIISLLAFIIRIFSKLAFSAYHLVRDAEEREQLTYVYLALKKEKGIDQTERHLIMQSLFSRADSGLLKEDASPTMPGNIVDKVIK